MEIGNTAMDILKDMVEKIADNPKSSTLQQTYDLDEYVKKYNATYDNVQMCLGYLQDKGYVNLIGRADEDDPYQIVTITPNGVDAIERG